MELEAGDLTWEQSRDKFTSKKAFPKQLFNAKRPN
jgi:hypothetical protein